MAAEAEKQVQGNGLTDEQLKIYSTIGGTPHLDGQYTVFGEVEEGLRTLHVKSSMASADWKLPTSVEWTLSADQ